jgi:hypothetical protein
MIVTGPHPQLSELQRFAVRERLWFPDIKRDAKEDAGAKLRRLMAVGVQI